MASRVRIAIDCMSGDSGLHDALSAARLAAQLHPDLEISLVGPQALITSLLSAEEQTVFSVVHADDVVSMSDKPLQVLRTKKQSSMAVSVGLLAEQSVDAVVSAGNTGALMAIGYFRLKTIPGIDRPAICSAIPAIGQPKYLLDLGANFDSSAEQLHQFAVMGSALAKVELAIEKPRVALLNIGEEPTKGNERVKLAAQFMAADEQLNYIGFTEANYLFKASADVVVADGFVGNVALKACEGTATHIAEMIEAEFSSSLLRRVAGFLSAPIIKSAYHKMDPQQYNGASFLGLNGVLVKCHGNSNDKGYYSAIAKARTNVRGNLLSAIESSISQQ